MRIGYIVAISILIVISLVWIFLPNLSILLIGQEKIQGAGVLVALFAAVVALSVADKKKQKIKVEIKDIRIKKWDQKVNTLQSTLKSINDIPEDKMKKRYAGFDQPVQFYIVEFKVINTSKFSWENPTFTYEFPISQRYLKERGNNIWEESLPNTNYHLYGASKVYWFVSGDRDIFSSMELPYLNSERELAIWFTMFLDPKMEKFIINMSINCKNAEGIVEEIEINPKELLKIYQENEREQSIS